MQYEYPDDMRPTPVRIRERFYRTSFPESVIAGWLEGREDTPLFVDIGTETTLYKPRFKDLKGKLVRLDDWEDMTDLQEKLVEYAPEDVYYKRTVEKDGRVEVNPEQELVFGLGPRHVSCNHCERKRAYMDEQWHPYVFCQDCFAHAASETRNLYAFLERHFDDMNVVYAGRQFHIHVNDPEAFKMPVGDREQLAKKVATQFPIDESITAGENDFVRLPGTVNGLVSRVAVPIPVSALVDPEQILAEHARLPDEQQG